MEKLKKYTCVEDAWNVLEPRRSVHSWDGGLVAVYSQLGSHALYSCTIVHNAKMKNVKAQLKKGERAEVKNIFYYPAYSPGQN